MDTLSDADKTFLLKAARQAITQVLSRGTVSEIPEEQLSEAIKADRACFVTLEKRGSGLRGCIGTFDTDTPLYRNVLSRAVAAATQDYRFMNNPVTVGEMKKINIKISVLSELKKIDSVEEIEVGKHGIWIKQDGRGGTYLPEVATELGWNRTEFLEHCCVEKAGLSKDAWKKEAEIYIYTSQILDEKEIVGK